MFFFRKAQSPVPQREALSIRLEAIGGQGAHSAGKIIAEAAVLGMNYSGHHFSSFGSEKRGSPVRSYVRFYRDRRPVRSSAPVVRPEILVVFHEALLEKHPEILADLSESTHVLVNTPKGAHELRLPAGVIVKNLALIDGLKIANKQRCGLNSVMLGAFARICPEISRESFESALDGFFRKLTPEQKKANTEGFSKGFEKVDLNESTSVRSSEIPEATVFPKMGWFNAPIGGVIINPGNSAIRDVSTSRRGSIPELKRDLCIQCGFCDMVCPDYCFVWKYDPKMMSIPYLEGIDYQYCKGCMKCIVACPMNALVPAEDNAEFVRGHRIVKFPEIKHEEIQVRSEQSWQTLMSENDAESAMLTVQGEQAKNPDTFLKPDFTDVPWPKGVEKK